MKKNAQDKTPMEGKRPFFARLLESQELQQAAGGATRKYPSDSDEAVTLKYPSDGDDFVTLKYPSDARTAAGYPARTRAVARSPRYRPWRDRCRRRG